MPVGTTRHRTHHRHHPLGTVRTVRHLCLCLTARRGIRCAPRRPRSAPEDAFGRHPSATHDAEAPDDRFAVHAASRRKAASEPHSTVHRSERGLVGVNTGHGGAGAPLIRRRPPDISHDRGDEHRDRNRNLSPHALKLFRELAESRDDQTLSVDALHDGDDV